MAAIYVKNENGEFVEIPTQGRSAYEIAKDNGFEGTEAEWLESLKASVQIEQNYYGTVTTFTVEGAEGTQETIIDTNPQRYDVISDISTNFISKASHNKYIICKAGGTCINVRAASNIRIGTVVHVVNVGGSNIIIDTDYAVAAATDLDEGQFMRQGADDILRITVNALKICTLFVYDTNEMLVTGAYSIKRVSTS